MRNTTGQRIKYMREVREWSQLELSKRIGINNSVLSRIEADKRPVETELLNKFADIFDTSTDYLSCRTDDPSPTLSAPSRLLIDSLDLTDEEIMEKIDFVVDGVRLSPEEVKRFIAFVRFQRSMDGS